MERLTHSVATAEDVVSLSLAERRMLARWLAEREPLPEKPATIRRRRRLAAIVASTAAAFLVPWTIYLSVTLPSRYTSHHWQVAWVGFDLALVGAFSMAAWSLWRARQVVVSALIVTGTLLVCDAWFDLTMSWGSNEQLGSVVTAALGEIPAAVALSVLAGRLLHRITSYVWHVSGREGEVPRLLKLPILVGPPTLVRRALREPRQRRAVGR